jgi:hypothetical protein
MSIALLTIALMGTASLLLSILLGYQVSAGARAVGHHFLAALGSTTLLVMAHSFIMFFLIATGVELKNMEKDHGWGDSFRRRTIALKGQVFPIATIALLLVIANFILGAAAHTRAMPVWIHHVLAWATFLTCGVTLWREYLVLGANNRLIEEAGMKRASGSGSRAG